jgi:hypothetical protein
MYIRLQESYLSGLFDGMWALSTPELACSSGVGCSSRPPAQPTSHHVQFRNHAGTSAVTTTVCCQRRYWPLPIPYLLADACTVFRGARVQFRLDPNHQVATLSHENLKAVCRKGKCHDATDASTALPACLPEK